MGKYDISVVDVSNLYWRAAVALDNKTTAEKVDIATKRLENFINTQAFECEKVYLLFDPMADIDDQKSLKSLDTAVSWRQSKIAEYKSDRKPMSSAEKQVLKTIYQKYCFETKFANIFVHHDLRYEADDYVASILKEPMNIGKKYIFCTADNDWARYLQYGDMMKTGLSTSLDKNIFTAKDFEAHTPKGALFGYVPTEATVTFMKVFYGDASDHIPGVFKLEDVKVMRSVSNAVKQCIKENYKMSLSEMTYSILNESGPFEECMKVLRLSQTAKINSKIATSIKNHLDVISPREEVKLNETICHKITLNDFTKKKIKL